ncbi:hypothetical protein BUALT_Bualt05G0162400 [Buddleja alternifolia]|uniref:Poor homologous synapsis 1 PH domain-containing protein n=1 Tax=Buddleja alternifolia TaxID=168488 RepID=A0AAV6XJQ2_9LAMI|nr:hypothetical protein BUALT_Bualt05G0162400 [Buddleja alternifolia]
MARQLVAISTAIAATTESETSTNNLQLSAVIDQWQVQYARFISYSSSTLKSTHPSLTPIQKHRLRGGTWISAADAACVKLNYHQSPAGLEDAVLVLSLGSRVLIVRIIVTLMCSKYCAISLAIQKFGLRFLTAYDAEKFMNVLKEILEKETPLQLQCSEFNSELSSQAEIIPSNEPANQIEGDWECATSVDNSIQPMLPSYEFNAAEDSVSQERTRDYEPAMTMSEFPPSFTELLKNCVPEVDKGCFAFLSCHIILSILFNYSQQYLEGTSFKDLLATVENVVSELGDDLVF